MSDGYDSSGRTEESYGYRPCTPLPIEIPALADRLAKLWREVPSEQHIYRFANGLGASVIRGEFTYGWDEGLWELGVIRWTGDGNDDWRLTYRTPITGDVLGWLTIDDVAEVLMRIATLEPLGELEELSDERDATAG